MERTTNGALFLPFPAPSAHKHTFLDFIYEKELKGRPELVHLTVLIGELKLRFKKKYQSVANFFKLQKLCYLYH